MTKGHRCPVCNTFTAQHHSTNRLRCSKCKSVYPKTVLIRG